MNKSKRPLFVMLLLAIFWPLKLLVVYFANCMSDLRAALANEWANRPRYDGWER
jgi:hypothetical protein